ncbi:hypothetical protein GUITHDRAFT_154554, partial [Guillardia theta CCMP2712]
QGGCGDISFSGVHVWGSAEALSNLLLSNPETIKGRRVLELGAGIGLPSLVACFFASHVCMTERREELIEHFRENVRRNLPLIRRRRARDASLRQEDFVTAQILRTYARGGDDAVSC